MLKVGKYSKYLKYFLHSRSFACTVYLIVSNVNLQTSKEVNTVANSLAIRNHFAIGWQNAFDGVGDLPVSYSKMCARVAVLEAEVALLKQYMV